VKHGAAAAVLLLLFSSAYQGCAPSRTVTHELPLGIGEVLGKVQERNQKIRTIAGSGTVTIESPEASHSGGFDVWLKKPDSLKVELKGPFGLHIGTLLLSRQRFIFYNRTNNTAVLGKPDGETLKSLFRLRMQFDEVVHAFTGEFPAPGPGDTLERFGTEGGLYMMRYRTATGAREYRVDGDTFIVASYRVLDRSGKPVLVALASEPEEQMPRMLRVVFPVERRSITVAYDDLQLNTPVVCSFSVPEQAEVIER
jgi:hypothetical protein